jgi:hypothetical protein
MSDRIRVLPLVILGALVVLGLALYWASTRSRESARDPVPPPEEAPPPASGSQGTTAPPVSKDPGDKILEGADGAFRRGMFPTALKFYKDFELRYAGTEVYDRNILKIWERLHTSHASTEKAKQEEGFAEYLAARRKLADEWTRLKPRLSSPPTPDSKAELLKFQESLPPTDGRRKAIEAWLSPPREEK